VDKQSSSVLIVDDERFFREAIREVLEAEGLSCVESSDADDAVALARDPSIGVVVLDIRLPGPDGTEVLRRLRELRSSLQVIVLSASTDQELVLEALRLGACDYLAKPLHDEELVLAVRRAAGSYSVASGWSGLQARLECLADRIESLTTALSSHRGDKRRELLHRGAVDTASDVLEARKTSLMLLSEDGAELRVAAARGRDLAANEMDPVPVGQGIAGLAIERIEAERVSDVGSDPRFAGRAGEGRYESPSFAIAPLAVGERRLGVLCATDRAGSGDFGAEDLCLLRLLAMQISELLAAEDSASRVEERVELSNASVRLAEESPDPAGETMIDPGGRGDDLDAELARLVCDAVVSEVEPQRVIRAVLEPLARSLDAAPVSLYLLDAEADVLRLEGQCDAGLRAERGELPRGRGLCGMVLATGHLVASDEPEADARYEGDVDTPADGVAGPLLCVPLQLRGKVVGLFRAFPRQGAAVSARTGEVLSAALSAAVRNVLLYRSLVESIEEVAAARRDAQQGPR
jgi:two-component system response regulator (stage 0 sporulation protein F)